MYCPCLHVKLISLLCYTADSNDVICILEVQQNVEVFSYAGFRIPPPFSRKKVPSPLNASCLAELETHPIHLSNDVDILHQAKATIWRVLFVDRNLIKDLKVKGTFKCMFHQESFANDRP
jgi:hypothetical protein